MTKKYLKNSDTGRILDYTDALAARPDFFLCDVDGNFLGDGSTGSGPDFKDQRIAQLTEQLEKAGAGMLVMELENKDQQLAAASGEISELQDVNALLTSENTRLMIQSDELRKEAGGKDPEKAKALETFLLTLKGSSNDDKQALSAWAELNIPLKLDPRGSLNKMSEMARAAVA